MSGSFALPTNDNLLLFDTSAAIALPDVDHEAHSAVLAFAKGHRLGLSGHAMFEVFSVLTRLPPPKRLSVADAARLIRANFPESRFIPEQQMPGLVTKFAAAGIAGGAVYDALVGTAARTHHATLVTCDAGARSTYDALGVTYQIISA